MNEQKIWGLYRSPSILTGQVLDVSNRPGTFIEDLDPHTLLEPLPQPGQLPLIPLGLRLALLAEETLHLDV